MTKEEILQRIQERLDRMYEHEWYTPLCFVEDMRSLVYHEKKKDIPGFEGTWEQLDKL